MILYKQLREKTLQTLKGAAKISPRAEWDFVIQNARLYDRMGCDVLALDLGLFCLFYHLFLFVTNSRLMLGLVRNWEFLIQPRENLRKPSVSDPRKMLRRRSSLVVDDSISPGFPNSSKGLKSLPQKVFEEPDTSSLLDDFGF